MEVRLFMYYRKKRAVAGKVAEYVNVSRQAAIKWEADTSRPSSDNLIKLAQLFEVDVDTLLSNGKAENSSIQNEVSTGKMPWIFIGISVLCILAYIVNSSVRDIFSIGILICMFILCVPNSMFVCLIMYGLTCIA